MPNTTQKTKKEGVLRPPVVVVMGHIDHGKSTLLDYIQKTNIAAQEAGQITQHLGAYEINHETAGGQRRLTFLDTPGHQAFETMRSRGATAADIAVLVVSAEEGVKVQTLEAWRVIQEAKLPVVIALSKIDRPAANPERTKQNLAENHIFLEGYGGDIPSVSISAKTGEGVPELLDLIFLVADLEELTADPKAQASGFVLEAHLDPRSGAGATLLIKDGTLLKNDYLVIEDLVTKFKRLENQAGKILSAASFSSPVRVSGLANLPSVGAIFQAVDNKKEAEKIAAQFQTLSSIQEAVGLPTRNSELPLVVKADSAGTREAVIKAIRELSTPEITPVIVSSGLGAVTETDIKLLGQGLAIGFRVKIDKTAADLAARQEVSVKNFEVIYELTEWLAEEIKRRRPPVEKTVGEVRILKIFSSDKNKQIVGGIVESGEIEKRDRCRIERNGFVLSQGTILDLEEKKQKVERVTTGQQFGALVETKIALAPGDRLIVSKWE